eukprot:snap_masked-scaffold_33-processed-gene-3.6-mRNA-1 protein AED:0.06 eAED:0.07 QI:0/-1/0/1/-1/1/1/0/340
MVYSPPKVESKYFPSYVEKLESQKGKVIAITGTTTGTGFCAAQVAYSKGATVFLLNRESSRIETMKKKLEEVTAEGKGSFETIECDLSDFESVKNAAKVLNEKCKDTGLDILVNNAGVMAMEDGVKDAAEKIIQDYDIQMKVNHLSHFLLTREVFGSLTKAANEKGQARIVNHSSGARLHPKGELKREYFGKNAGNLGGNGASMIFGGARWVRYKQSKLANSVFTKALKQKLEESGSKVIAACGEPGLASTELQSTTTKKGGLGNFFTTMLMKFSQSAEDGALSIIKCMFDGEVKNGEMWGPGGLRGDPKRIGHGKFTTEAGMKLLWEESEKAVGEFKIE